ncbi:MAG TPA: enoyl-CoA hydratase/isomerase family protein [Acidimicrobiia bacterium]|nr:enoyl-CoA hydratase/isomerase family protein [Acidimicrobiia bacterium]
MSIPDFETITYDEGDDGVAVVTLNRPDVHNAFNSLMQRELHSLWRVLRRHDPVRCIVLTGAGDKAFCTGIDRMEQMGGESDETTDRDVVGSGTTPFMFNDPGDNIGPKSCDLWKPVIAAVNGMACGGAFYMLGEVEFIIAAEHATFFDPHVTYGMTAAFEPIHMSGITPFPEIMRLSLLGNYERMSAQRAFQIGMVSEVVSADALRARAHELAAIIASQPRLAIEGTVRAIWSTRSMPQREAVRLGYAYVAMGTNQESIAEGQQLFASGKRVEWKLR